MKAAEETEERKKEEEEETASCGLAIDTWGDWAVKKFCVCFKLYLSLMSFLFTIHLKRLIAVKIKNKNKAVICTNWPK